MYEVDVTGAVVTAHGRCPGCWCAPLLAGFSRGQAHYLHRSCQPKPRPKRRGAWGGPVPE